MTLPVLVGWLAGCATGTVDVFWVAGRMTVPFVLVGAAIALEAERRRAEAAPQQAAHA